MKIKPFEAIRVHPAQESQLTATAPQTVSVALGLAPDDLPLKIALETPARQRPETIEGQAGAYAEIKTALETFCEMNVLQRDTVPGLYIYEVSTASGSQTGIWCLADLTDYTDGHIKIHELTFGESLRRLEAYRSATGLEGSPVLLTYFPKESINELIAAIKMRKPYLRLSNEDAAHQLWKIEDPELQGKLIREFAAIEKAYLADGHHRLGSAARLALAQKAAGHRINNNITALYMATDQLRIEPYHRIVLQEKQVDKAAFIKAISESFYISESFTNHPVLPKVAHHIGLLMEGQWYQLVAKSDPIEMEPSDADILQHHLFAPFFGIADPKNDQRLKYIGGEAAMTEIEAFVADHPQALVFTICAVPLEELIAAADAGGSLPPKSTWIDPKIPYGLLLYQFQPNF